MLTLLREESYQPVKLSALGRKLNLPRSQHEALREVLRELHRQGAIELGKGRSIRIAPQKGEFVGLFHAIRKGGGFVRPKPGGAKFPDIHIRADRAADAASGDVVLVAILRPGRGPRGPEGRIVEVIERASQEFVGTYFLRGSEAFVHVDGTVFHEPIYVGDPGVKGAQDGDKVVFEMLRFPSAELFGEGVIREVLGPRGDPDAETKSVLRQFKIPDEFSPDALAEARTEARRFEEARTDPHRLDLTASTIVTIDPTDARDFDDAVSLERDEQGFWRLGVHIADVAEFVRPGTALDAEARSRGTSVYLPGKVVPMLPELLSNGLASLQEDRPRFTKSVFVEFDAEGRITAVDFANSVIRVTRRLTYDEVQQFFDKPGRHRKDFVPEVAQLLERLRELASLLRERRRRRGFLELSMPEPRVQMDADGRVTGAVYLLQDEAHRLIEEFMLTANEAVAQKLADEGLAFLRRVHENPDPLKLRVFAEFARSLGIEIKDPESRFELQRVANETRGKPEEAAVHYAMLRSMKEAIYSPEEEGHYALASPCYCHFTSPIRRYPDLTIHRMLDALIRVGKARFDRAELLVLGEHCSYTERRAAKAERELTKLKILNFLSDKVGTELDMIITGVEDFGFFAQARTIPAEGLVHVRTLPDDYYVYEASTHTLSGRRTGNEFRLGAQVRCVIAKVDLNQRQLDLRLAEGDAAPRPAPAPRATKGQRVSPRKKSQRPAGKGKRRR